MATIRELIVRDSLMKYWQDNPMSLAQLGRNMDMCVYTLRRLLYSEKKIQVKTMLKVELFLRDK